ncbi:MAG: hypothetical protein KYX64_06750 [Sphingopyxis sp.]|nr:hypothetical protein [Sphingopyxis sp.]
MTKLSEKLVGKAITLVCFGEYVGFIHMGDKDHCRIESETVIIGKGGNEHALFPEPAQGALPLVLGAKVEAIAIDNTVTISLDNGHKIRAALTDGYETIMLSVDGQSEVY